MSAVHVDLDGETHVAVTLVDDPAAELHDWYGRYLYFAPDELEPLAGPHRTADRSERRARHEGARSPDHAPAGAAWRGPSSSASAPCRT